MSGGAGGSCFNGPLLESSRGSVSSNVSAMSHSRHSYSEYLGNVLKYTQIKTLILQKLSSGRQLRSTGITPSDRV